MKTLGWIILAFLFLPVLTRKTAGATAAVGQPGGATLVTLPSDLLSSFFGGTAPPSATNDPLGLAIGASPTGGGNAASNPDGTVVQHPDGTITVDGILYGPDGLPVVFGPPSPAPGDIVQANTDLAKAQAASGAGTGIIVDSGGDTTNLNLATFGL